MNEETILGTALEMPPDARAAYLVEACGNDETLRERLERLLAASEKVGNFMAKPAVAPAVDPGVTEALSLSADGAAKTASADEEPLTFLTPSARRDSLGRLGHYEVLQVLGRAGSASSSGRSTRCCSGSWLSRCMAPQLAATSPARKRFLREARSSAQVRHENVVQVYEVGEQPLPYLVMEFIPGETLQQKLDRVGPLDVPEMLRIGRQIAEGLAAAHAKELIHRDIKPGNMLLEGGQPEGEDHRLRPGPHGRRRQHLAERHHRRHADVHVPRAGARADPRPAGRPVQPRQRALPDGYRPAAVPGHRHAGGAEAGRRGHAAPIREIIPETPQWLCDIIAKLHAKNPDDRYQSA